MDTQNEGRQKFMEFPFVSAPHKKLMVDLVLALENRLEEQLLPCTLPPDVQYHRNQSGTVQASFQIRSGLTDSPIDFIWGSWVHAELPTGSSMDITSFSAYLDRSNDAPNFGIDLIRHSKTMLVLILDLFPRKELALCPEYLQTFYESTQLDTHSQALDKLPEVHPYISPSLYMRSTTSPTAIMVRINTQEAGGAERLEEIIRNHLDPISKQVLKIWLDHCVSSKRDVGETERAYLKKRDGVTRSQNMEIDFGPSFLELFGEEAGKKLLDSIKEYFSV